MGRIKRFSSLMIILVLFLVLISNASAQTIGISPSSIHNSHLRATNSFTQNIILSFDIDEPVLAKATLRGQVASWVEIKEEFLLDSSSKKMHFPVTIKVPAEALPGSYEGQIQLLFLPSNNQESGSNIYPGFSIPLKLEVTDSVQELFTIRNLGVTQEKTSLLLSYTLFNEGNVKSGPNHVDVKIYNNLKDTLLHEANVDLTLIDEFSFQEQILALNGVELEQNKLYWILTTFSNDRHSYQEYVALDLYQAPKEVQIETQTTSEPNLETTSAMGSTQHVEALDQTSLSNLDPLTALVIVICLLFLVVFVFLYKVNSTKSSNNKKRKK